MAIVIRKDRVLNPTRFEKCEKSVAEKGGAYSPAGVCAAAGRRKYGKKKFQAMAKAGKARAANPKQFYKVWFSRGKERTAALVLDTDRFPVPGTSIEKYSRLFPVSEARLMQRIHIGKRYLTWEEAFKSAGNPTYQQGQSNERFDRALEKAKLLEQERKSQERRYYQDLARRLEKPKRRKRR